MATVVMTTRIDRTPADVFAVLADVSKNTAWSKTSILGRLTSPPPVGLGSTAREVSRFIGRRIEVDSTIVAFDSDRTFSFVTSTGPFPFRRYVADGDRPALAPCSHRSSWPSRPASSGSETGCSAP